MEKAVVDLIMQWAENNKRTGEGVFTSRGPAYVESVREDGVDLRLAWPRNDETFTLSLEEFGHEQKILV